MHFAIATPLRTNRCQPESNHGLLQADRQGRASDFGAAYAKSEYKRAADKEIAAQLAMASDLGAWVLLRWTPADLLSLAIALTFRSPSIWHHCLLSG